MKTEDNKNNLKKRLIQKSSQPIIYTALNKIISQSFSFISILLLVRILSSKDFGVYNLLYSIIAMCGMFFSFGLINILYRYIPEYFVSEKFDLANKLFHFLSLLRLLSNVILIVIVLFTWDHLAPLIKLDPYKESFFVFCLVLICYQQWILIKIYLEACFLHKYTSTLYSIALLFKVSSYVLAYYFSFNLSEILTIDLIATAFLLVSHYCFVGKLPKNESVHTFDKTEKKRLIRYGLFYNFSDMGTQIIDYNLDNIFLAYFLSPIDVGIYGAFHRIANFLSRANPANFLSDVIRPLFISLSIGSERNKIQEMFQFTLKYSLILFFPAIIFALSIPKQIISLLLGKFSEHSLVFILILIFEMLNQLSFPISMVAQCQERVDVILFSKIFAIYNILANIFFIQYLGIIGAVIATGTTIVFKNSYIIWKLLKFVSFKSVGKFIWYSLLLWSAVYLLIIFFKMHLSYGLGCILTYCMFLIFTALYLLFSFASNEKELEVFKLLSENKRLGFLVELIKLRYKILKIMGIS